ncbi:MAG: glycosyltransferase [Salinivirgaceae bacterium]|nr:glycosyltransferase [Salinivirgaceae bacterium]
MHNSKTLIILTRGFPYGSGEAFLETELFFLSQNYGKILIFAQTDHIYSEFNSDEMREVPKNVSVEKINTYKKPTPLKILKNLLLTNFLISEITHLDIHIIFNKKVIRTAFQYYFKAVHNYNFIKRKINKNRNNLFYSYWSFEEPLTMIMLKNKFKGVCFARAHGGDVYEQLQENNYLPFRKIYLKKLDKIFTVSEKGQKHITKHNYFINKVAVSKLGTLPGVFNLDKTENVLKIISIGALYNIKRIDLLINSISLINSIPIRWIHFGTGPDKQEIHTLAKNKLNKVNINYNFEGFINNNDLRSFLNNNYFDVSLNTSSSEGIAVSIMETMSFGIPCIATAVGGTPEIVNNENGYLLTENPTPKEVAEKIMQYFWLPTEQKQNKRIHAYQTWNEKHNAEKNYNFFIKEINSLKFKSVKTE